MRESEVRLVNKRERIMAALAGQEVDRVPVSFWMHFPAHDPRPEALARAQLAFHGKYDLDLLKMMPHGQHSTLDWGNRIRRFNDPYRTEEVVEYAIKRPEDWAGVDLLDVEKGCFGEQLRAAELIGREIDDAPYVQTVFSPLTTAHKLSGGAVVEYLRQEPELVHSALEAITETTVQYALKSIERGADGIFFAIKTASARVMKAEEYAAFGRPYDLRVLRAVRRVADIIILHLHGLDIMFEELLDYPADIINWHDRRTSPTLSRARALTSRCLAGGIDEVGTCYRGTADDITREIHDAIDQTGGKGLIIAPGCVFPPDISEERLMAARRAVERHPRGSRPH